MTERRDVERREEALKCLIEVWIKRDGHSHLGDLAVRSEIDERRALLLLRLLDFLPRDTERDLERVLERDRERSAALTTFLLRGVTRPLASRCLNCITNTS